VIRLVDIVLLAHRILRDAPGEPELGRAAIAWTFLNRAAAAARHRRQHGAPHPQFGDGSVRAACRLAGEAWGGRRTLPVHDPAFCRALATACLASCRDIADPTSGATHYHHHQDTPCWSDDLRPVALIGSFIFYRSRR
jgi:N-acetylmuramoyl-L-alanine amidase